MSDAILDIFCPACDRAGNLNSRMVRIQHTKTAEAGMMVKCQAGSHTFEYQRLLGLHPRMIKPQVIEKQPKDSKNLTLWVHPMVEETLRARFPQNFMTTMYSVLHAVADPDSLLIIGEHARALRAKGLITQSREILGLADRLKVAEEALAQARIREQALAPIFAAMGIGAVPQAGQPAALGSPFVMPAGMQAGQNFAAASQPAAAALPDFCNPNSPNYDAVAAAMYEAGDISAEYAEDQAGADAQHGLPRPVHG